MNKIPTDKTTLRNIILMQAEAASPASLPVSTILTGLKTAGFNIDENTLKAELDYLVQKEMLILSPSEICPANKRIKLSAHGKDYLESDDI